MLILSKSMHNFWQLQHLSSTQQNSLLLYKHCLIFYYNTILFYFKFLCYLQYTASYYFDDAAVILYCFITFIISSMASNIVKLYSIIFKLLLKHYYLFILFIGIIFKLRLNLLKKKKNDDEYKNENKLNHHCQPRCHHI